MIVDLFLVPKAVRIANDHIGIQNALFTSFRMLEMTKQKKLKLEGFFVAAG